MQYLDDTAHVISNITKIISLPNAGDFCIDDHNLTKSYQMSNIRQQMTKCVKSDMQNLTKNILNQKWSMLCVPISVATLLRFAMKNDLTFADKYNEYTIERILIRVQNPPNFFWSGAVERSLRKSVERSSKPAPPLHGF